MKKNYFASDHLFDAVPDCRMRGAYKNLHEYQ